MAGKPRETTGDFNNVHSLSYIIHSLTAERGTGEGMQIKKWNVPLPLDCDVFLCTVNLIARVC